MITVCAMILESGALYLCGGIVFIAFEFGVAGRLSIDVVRHASTAKGDTILMRLLAKQTEGVVLAQLVGIAPTIIAARVALGKSVENMGASAAADPLDDEVLYIRPESVKVKAV
ncbi:hypothetical protein MVEN_02362500 [Mycena venus]|uniref:Uncharacterized protein n=1 Tax=Mycena venus TaxID=2733690 RepID=A0A8H7CFF0_9AGAR|nr:hypothetical protein MVEN_02362500 [Mycena venus]